MGIRDLGRLTAALYLSTSVAVLSTTALASNVYDCEKDVKNAKATLAQNEKLARELKMPAVWWVRYPRNIDSTYIKCMGERIPKATNGRYTFEKVSEVDDSVFYEFREVRNKK